MSIRQAVPDTEIVIVGREPPAALADAARSNGVRLVANPADVRPFLEAAILVVPLVIGGGTRFKIIEAMAAGCPVISTAKGIEGIEARDGTHYLGAEDPASFAAAVRHTVSDRGAAQRRRTAGRELVRTRYSWDSLAERVAAILGSVGVARGQA